MKNLSYFLFFVMSEYIKSEATVFDMAKFFGKVSFLFKILLDFCYNSSAENDIAVIQNDRLTGCDCASRLVQNDFN